MRSVSFRILFVTAAAACSSSLVSASAPSWLRWQRQRPSTLHYRLHSNTRASTIVGKLRGGGDGDDEPSPGVQKKKRKAKASKKLPVATESDDVVPVEEGDDAEGTDAKTVIDSVMKETDAATALGDAIRDRADLLRRDRLPYSERIFDAALVSLGLSLGTAGTDRDGEWDGTSVEEGDDDAPMVDTLAYYQYGHRNSVYPEVNQRHVQLSTSTVVANYFLRTHGGTHIVQCMLSLLASLLGVACLVLPAFPSPAAAGATVAAGATTAAAKAAINAKSLSRKILLSSIKYQLMQQTLLLATAKHASGLLGAVSLGASRIPQLGVRNARRYLESVASDPVGQYLFYCSLLVAWIGWFGGGAGGVRQYVARLKGSVISIMNASAAATASASSPNAAGSDGNASQDVAAATLAQLLDTLSQQPPPWFLSQSTGGFAVPILILGPVLLREVTSTLWVFSDVLTLAVASSGSGTITGRFCSWTLSGCRSILDAFMSILITSDQWKKADSFRRQRALARLVSRCSLVMELIVGVVLMGDAIQSFWKFAFVGVGDISGGGSGHLPFQCVVGKIVCAHLYLNFLLSRRKKIAAVIGSVRGGASDGAMINGALGVLIDPRKEMGLLKDAVDED